MRRRTFLATVPLAASGVVLDTQVPGPHTAMSRTMDQAAQGG